MYDEFLNTRLSLRKIVIRVSLLAVILSECSSGSVLILVFICIKFAMINECDGNGRDEGLKIRKVEVKEMDQKLLSLEFPMFFVSMFMEILFLPVRFWISRRSFLVLD